MSLENLSINDGKRFGRQDIAFCLVRQPESDEIFFGSSDAKIHRIDLATEKPESTPFSGEGHTSYVTGVTRAGESLVSSSYDRHLCWWNSETGALIRKTRAHDKWIRNVVASPDGRVIASVADDMVCRLWNAVTGEMIRELHGHDAITQNDYPSMLFTCAFSPDGQFLATADKVGHIVIWEVASGKSVITLEAPTMYTWDPKARRHSIGGIRSLAFSPDGKTLAVGGMGQVGNIDHLGGKARVRAFDWQTGETLAEIETDKVKGLVEQLQWADDGSFLLGMGGDNKGLSLVIDPAGWKIASEKVMPFHVHDFVLAEDEKRIFAVGHNNLGLMEIVEA